MKKRNVVTPHSDLGLNALRLLALSTVGYYFYKSYKKEGSLLGATGKAVAFNVNTDKIVESVAPSLGLDDDQKQTFKSIAQQIKTEIIK